MKKIAVLASIALLTLTSCAQKQAPEETNTQTGTTQDTTAQVTPEQNTPNPAALQDFPEMSIDENSPVVKEGDKVAVHYVGKLEDGTIFDSSLPRGTPLEFTIGEKNMIPGFEQGVVAMKVGERKTLTLSPEQAYGLRDETKKQVVEKSALQGSEALKVGDKVYDQFGRAFSIAEIGDTTVTVDTNHELAGKTLIFDVQMVKIN